jgi:hypothetical protein
MSRGSKRNALLVGIRQSWSCGTISSAPASLSVPAAEGP